MKKLIIPLFLLLTSSLFAQKITIRGNLLGDANINIKDNYEVRIYEEGSFKPLQVLSMYDRYFPGDTIAIFYTSKLVSNLRLEIIAEGYKKYSLNIVNIHWSNQNFLKIVGNLTLKASDLPKVKSIVHGYDKGNMFHYFEITFFNPTQKKILIKNMSIFSSEYRSDPFACFSPTPPEPTFFIGDQLKIIRSENQSIVLKGNYSDQSSEISVPVNGEIGIKRCSHINYLKLNIKCSFTLLEKDYSKIKIYFPMTILMTQTEESKKMIRYFKEEYNIDLPKKMLDFKSFDFVFESAEDDELPIKASYDLK
jgi:hypothetical protein